MKKKTRESVFTFARNRCSRSLGIGVHIRSESVFTFARNRCSHSLGIGVHIRSEYAAAGGCGGLKLLRKEKGFGFRQSETSVGLRPPFVSDCLSVYLALVGIHLKKEKSCLKMGPPLTSAKAFLSSNCFSSKSLYFLPIVAYLPVVCLVNLNQPDTPLFFKTSVHRI